MCPPFLRVNVREHHMASDAGKLMLEHQMAYDQYPPVQERERAAGL
jgi:hypothetical protein